MPGREATQPRRLVIVLGDQLDERSSALDEFDPSRDAVWMAEVSDESTHVWSHQARIVVFLSAMRHYRDRLRRRGVTVHYRELGEDDPDRGLAAELETAARRLRPRQLVMTQAGAWRVQDAIERLARRIGCDLEVRPDRHFLCGKEEFADHAAERKQLRMEFFYRRMRRKHGVLMDGDEPEGGKWNFDAENRKPFGREGPAGLPLPPSFPPDPTTREVIRLVGRRFASHPGSLAHFDWPVTPEQAETALADFIENRLAHFGPHQDAMWSGEPFLAHSLLSSAMNLKLLDPRGAIRAAEEAYRGGHVPIASAEGFLRQILGWREYVRGVYWRFMPEYLQRNAVEARLPLPGFYWTGQTEMNCLRQAIGQTLDYGYAHHIQRLMVTGLFALLLGVDPRQVHAWYLAVYVDAVEWVELPNTLGMSQYADGGVMASKPYCASGQYIRRMSNYCRECRYDPGRAAGERACPFTTLYWDFLGRNASRLERNRRMAMQLRNLARKPAAQRREIAGQAESLRGQLMK